MNLYNVKQAAKMLAVSHWTVRALIRSGKLRPVRVGRLVRLDEQELEKFVSLAKSVAGDAQLIEKENANA